VAVKRGIGEVMLAQSDVSVSVDASASSEDLARALKDRAKELGFDLCGITSAVSPTTFGHLQSWLRHGYAGEMNYIERRENAYRSPAGVLTGVRSVVMLAMNYHVGPKAQGLQPSGFGRVARYAWSSTD
jgi:epoxyqueuosine reductase